MGERADELNPRQESSRDVFADTGETMPTFRSASDGGLSDAEETEETQELRADIQQTRAEMGGTIDALQERLAPQNLVDQAKDAAVEAATGAVESAKGAVREATIGRAERVTSNVTDTARETGSSFMETIRENPIPAALAGIGLGWLWMNRRRPAKDGYSTDRYAWDYNRRAFEPRAQRDDAFDHAGHSGSGMASQVRESAGQVASQATELASDAGERFQEARDSVWQTVRRNPLPVAMTAVGIAWLMNQREPSAPDYGYYGGTGYGYPTRDTDTNGVRQTASEIGDQIRGAADQAQEQVGAVGRTVQQRTRRTQNEVMTWVNDNPLGVAAVALGLGTAVGLAVPGTRQEGQLMGEARDALMDRAREVAEDTGQRVQRVAEQAKEAATEEAHNQNLTP